MSNERYALFLDRDGTLIEDKEYLSNPNNVRLLPGVKSCLHALYQQGWLFFLFSNQSGVGRGFFTLNDVHACNRRMLKLIGLGQNLFSQICLPTSTPDAPCAYRKPSPKFIFECMDKFDLNPDHCWMIGDKEIDMQAGQSACVHTLLISSTYQPPWVRCKNFEEVEMKLCGKDLDV